MSVLEGKYIVFIYRERFDDSLASALSVYHFKHGGLNKVFSPGTIFNVHELKNKIRDSKTGRRVGVNELVIRKLKEMDVGEVVTVSRRRKFFSVPHGIQNLGDEETICTCLWDTICVDDQEYALLIKSGIKVRFFDHEKDMFIE